MSNDKLARSYDSIAVVARLQAENARLREALLLFARMDAINPPEDMPLTEWLPAITGARAALTTAKQD